MHQPPIPHVASTDPEIADLIESEARRQFEKIRLIPSENYVSEAVLEATGSVLTNKYSEGYPGRRYYEGQQFIDPLERSRCNAHRRCSAPSTSTSSPTRDPGEPRRVPGLPQAGRHRDGDGAAGGRSPDPRLAGVSHGQVLQVGPVRRPRRHRPHRLRRGRDLARQRAAEVIFCGGTAFPRTIDFPAFAEIAAEAGADPGGRHRAYRRPGRRRRAPEPGRHRRRDHHHHAQDAARAARRDDHVQDRARPGDRQGGLPRSAGRPAQSHHGGDRRGAEGGGAARVQRVRAADRRQRQGAGRRRCPSAASAWSPAAPTTT